MREQLEKMTVRTSAATADAPLKMWSESGPEWGGKICAAYRFGPGFDARSALEGLPDAMCPAPHWGYCFKGSLRVRYKDGTEEVIKAGDLFYMPPGHTFFTDQDAEEDCELIEFSEAPDA